MTGMWIGSAARRVGALIVCMAAGAFVWPENVAAQFAHRIDAIQHWGPLLLAPVVVGLISRRDWVQRALALTAGEYLAAALRTESFLVAYLFLLLPVLLTLINASGVLAAAAVMAARGARSGRDAAPVSCGAARATASPRSGPSLGARAAQ